MKKDAVISALGQHRYSLSRIWDEDKGKVLFIMLNPSTANAIHDDPTTIRCINYAKKWGYGGLTIGNMYPYRTKSPKELMAWKIFGSRYSVFKKNQEHVKEMAEEAHVIVLAWGANYEGLFPVWLFQFGHKMFYLELCKDGNTPKHPLGLSKKIDWYKFYDLQTRYDNGWII